MARTAKMTVTLPKELISFADEVAKEKKVSRSKIVSSCLEAMAEERRVREMAEGYKAMARENLRFAADAMKIAHEVMPEWKE